MGGYSEKCPYCDRWFVAPGAIHQHLRDSHDWTSQQIKSLKEQTRQIGALTDSIVFKALDKQE